jgi:hypothetical protein
MGVWRGPEKSIKLSELSDGEYHWVEFPGNPYKYETGKYIWFSGGSEAEYNYVDRIIAVNSATVGLKDKNTLPFKFDLQQNYPNPFNPTTKITYSLPQASQVKLMVYNILGQKVKQLVDGFRPAGDNEVEFNAENLSSGLYIYKLEMDGKMKKEKTMKMLLIK